MEIILYECNDSNNTINKTYINPLAVQVNLKNDVDILTPVINFRFDSFSDIKTKNYCFINDFSRYYFISSMEIINNNICSISLEIDVLESFKDDILNSYGDINKSNKYNHFHNDGLESLEEKEIKLYYSDVVLQESKTIILSTIGG